MEKAKRENCKYFPQLSQSEKVLGYRKDNEKVADEKFKQNSKERLQNITNKKLQTSFIGALDRFEKFFGRIWGFGKKKEECTPNELKWRQIWEECRNEVLNNGNAQIRALATELLQYEMKWMRHRYTITPEN